MDMTTTTAVVTATTSAAAATSSMVSMDMDGGGMGGECKISMLWNWYTIDACFLSSQWHITSAGMMAGSCIGVICLVIWLEGLRRAAREYDAFITHQAAQAASISCSEHTNNAMMEPQHIDTASSPKGATMQVIPTAAATPPGAPRASFTPTLPQQLIRAGLHMLQFAVAYFIMLLAMYFNGYIIICIIIGAFIGSFIFSWHRLKLPGSNEREVTFCCG